MTPSRFQVPDAAAPGAEASVSGGPPEVSNFLSWSCTRNAKYRLSKDQNALKAPSVPDKERHAGLSKSRIQSPFRAAVTSLRPSGETAIKSLGAAFSGRSASKILDEPGAFG